MQGRVGEGLPQDPEEGAQGPGLPGGSCLVTCVHFSLRGLPEVNHMRNRSRFMRQSKLWLNHSQVATSEKLDDAEGWRKPNRIYSTLEVFPGRALGTGGRPCALILPSLPQVFAQTSPHCIFLDHRLWQRDHAPVPSVSCLALSFSTALVTICLPPTFF